MCHLCCHTVKGGHRKLLKIVFCQSNDHTITGKWFEKRGQNLIHRVLRLNISSDIEILLVKMKLLAHPSVKKWKMSDTSKWSQNMIKPSSSNSFCCSLSQTVKQLLADVAVVSGCNNYKPIQPQSFNCISSLQAGSCSCDHSFIPSDTHSNKDYLSTIIIISVCL